MDLFRLSFKDTPSFSAHQIKDDRVLGTLPSILSVGLYRLIRLGAFVEDLVASENVVGVFPGVHIDKPQRDFRLAREDGDSLYV
ncbi:hypothetical protein Krac_5081 [Ktedonobacter racemifer DSM 44963]|uniref:Uncharacterized protein n=1 Tax=Ktedonobacter racemifer DSM 44963 TaxID=485913 RepID=D6TUJ8_KTERA|nr:hypothetical protein Krac_5081 [Ktedonobacter racemifer DSM 44963]